MVGADVAKGGHMVGRVVVAVGGGGWFWVGTGWV
jgi:hypothetical protein